MDAAADSGVSNQLRATLNLQAEERSGLRASNILGIVPGRSEENIIINAHRILN